MSAIETAVTAQGFAHCEKPERYIKQLVSHWGHKYATSYDEGDGMGSFPFSEAKTKRQALLFSELFSVSVRRDVLRLPIRAKTRINDPRTTSTLFVIW